MINHPYIQAALARERRNTFLAEAQTARLASQARLRRPRAGVSAARRSPLRWVPNWLLSVWSHRQIRPLHQPVFQDDDLGAERLGVGAAQDFFRRPPAANNRSPRMDANADVTMTANPVTRSTVSAQAHDSRAERGIADRPPTAARDKRVVLRDGSEVLIRQVQSADAPLLADGFARLSAESRRLRFLRGKDELSPAELRYFTEVDHHDHEALGALNHLDGRGVGIARYIRHAEDPQAAEIAVTIVDDWQGRGLGTELLAQLSDRARQEGIRRFTALVSADNVAVAGLLRNISAGLVRRESSTLEYEITLAPCEKYDHTRRAPRSG